MFYDNELNRLKAKFKTEYSKFEAIHNQYVAFREQVEEERKILEELHINEAFKDADAKEMKAILEAREEAIKALKEDEDKLRILEAESKKQHSRHYKLGHIIRRLNTLTTLSSAKEIYNKLNEHVVGQDEAKKALATAAFNNILRAYKSIMQPNDPTQIDKDIVLMIGKTGTGKTLLVQELARILNVPVVIGDATRVTQHGFTGDSVDAWVQELFDKARDMASGATGGGDDATLTDTFADELFYKGIIFIDEFDKMATRFEDSANGNSKNGVQFNLLKLIEGAVYRLKVDKDETVDFDTRPVMFILGGAFSELDKEMEGKNSIGFSSDFVQKGTKRKITDEDIIKYGFSRELVGRITEIVQLDDMTEELLVKIATHGENSPVNRYKKLFELHKVKAEIDDKLIKELAHKAINMGAGARALNKVFKEFFRPYEFEASEYMGKTLRFETTKPEAQKTLKLSH